MDDTPPIPPDDIARRREAFVTKRADYITIDGWTGIKARDQVTRAIDAGLLEHDAARSKLNSDSQYIALS
ncbi:hypothetical protein [Croceicoccus sp. YJ47]|uniref:hypothetical protein n=1 Tax=Croceicoccus sp. YJ47 TaxID=2798724 RepID=UPI00192129F2|nr:hypothetical protein [Croceicoccus sp. YJ47]QQN75020.1 hypothetical protein JD971_04810 [Croceicoccus sp. YJ47]